MPEMTIEALAQEIRQRLDGVDTKVSEGTSDERLKSMIKTNLEELVTGDTEFVRKIRFGSTPTEAQLVGTKYARWGLSVADVEFLYDLQGSIRGQRRSGGRGGVYEGPSEELTRTFEAISSARYMSGEQVREIDRKAIDDLFPRLPLDMYRGEDRALAARGAYELTGAYQRALRAMDTAESGFGQQLIGAQYVGDLWDAPRRTSRIFSLLNSFEMTDPTAYLPVEVDFPEMLYVSESVNHDSANYPTSKTGSNRVQVDAKKFVIHQMWSGEMDEDSIIPYIPFLRRQAALSIGHHSDSLVLNGDTTATSSNINTSGTPASTKHYLAMDGIRHAALVDNTANVTNAGGAVTLAHLAGLRGLMIDEARYHDWGHPTDPNDLVYVCDPATGDAAAQIDEVLTVDKYGAQATVHNGELARVLGHPLIGSMAMSRTQADGTVHATGSNNTQGQVAAFNRRGYTVGWRRRIRVESERLPASDQTRIVYSLRLGLGRFTPTGAASGIEHSAVLRNIDL